MLSTLNLPKEKTRPPLFYLKPPQVCPNKDGLAKGFPWESVTLYHKRYCGELMITDNTNSSVVQPYADILNQHWPVDTYNSSLLCNFIYFFILFYFYLFIFLDFFFNVDHF